MKRGVVLATVAIIAVGLAGVSLAATPRQVARANRALAISAGDEVLSSLALPGGSTRVAEKPTDDHGELARGVGVLWYAAEVDRVGFWVTAASPGAVVSSIAAHVPAGATAYGRGWSGGPDIDSYESWSLPQNGGRQIGQQLLSLEAVQLANSKTGVRADVWVQYIAPRRPGQTVPAQARILDVTVAEGVSTKVLVSDEATDLRTVRRIAALVNSLPFAGGPPEAISCPDFTTNRPLDTFRFKATPAGKTLATVSLYSDTPPTADPCATTSLLIQGHRQRPLAEGGALLKQAGKMLGINLTDIARPNT